MPCTPETITSQELAAVGQRIHEILTGSKDVSTLTDDERIGLDNLLDVVQNVNRLVENKNLAPEDQILLNRALKDLRTPDARRIINKVRTQLINEKKAEPGLLDKVAEWTGAMYLWRLSSVGKSLVSNLARNLLKYPEIKMAAWINKGVVRRNNVALSRFDGEAMEDFRATWQQGEFRRSFDVAMNVMREDPKATDDLLFFEREQIKKRAIEGKKGTIIRAGLNAQGAADILYRLPALHGEIARLVFRKAKSMGGDRFDLMKNGQEIRAKVEQVAGLKKKGEKIPDELAEYAQIIDEATKNSEALTFQSELTGIAKALSELRRFPAIRIFVPFLNTQMNILQQAYARSPLAVFNSDFRDLASKYISKQITASDAGELSDRVAQIAVGTAIYSIMIGAMAALADDWEITGDYDEDKIKEKPTGWQPNSIRIGNTYIGYQSIEPFATMFRFWGNAADSKNSAPAAMLESLAKLTVINPMTEEVLNITEALKDGKVDEFFVKMVAGMALPGIAQDVSKIIDPTVRRKDGLIDKALVGAGAIGYSTTLPPVVDVFGQDLEPQSRGERAVKALTGFIAVSQDKEDDARKEIRRLGLKFRVSTYTHKGVELTPDETLRLNRMAGEQFHKQVKAMLNNPTYQAKSDEKKAKTIKAVRTELLDKYKLAIAKELEFKQRKAALKSKQE